jgi:hypothetical protein
MGSCKAVREMVREMLRDVVACLAGPQEECLEALNGSAGLVLQGMHAAPAVVDICGAAQQRKGVDYFPTRKELNPPFCGRLRRFIPNFIDELMQFVLTQLSWSHEMPLYEGDFLSRLGTEDNCDPSRRYKNYCFCRCWSYQARMRWSRSTKCFSS